MSDIEDLRYTATMAALQAERAFLEVELAEMEPRRAALQDRIGQIDQAMATGVPIEPKFSYSRSPASAQETLTAAHRFPSPHVEPDLAPASGPEGHGRVPPPRPMRPRASAGTPRSITPQSEQALVTSGAPVDPSLFGMGAGPNGEQPSPRAPDPEDAAFVQRMAQVAGSDDDAWLDDPRYNAGPEHTDPYKRQVGES